ncbi:hypothetical protein Hypma_002821 [Hypsizygus marmoreus]|uniref:Uncharacterized protein n=1 Tax=Hypsizygus marmoreus TaxID=39966 RepID=A0A369J3M4_HYPMA|nr:hypothetical protein Hypma_002821 [Hypsizygus marmoreus]
MAGFLRKKKHDTQAKPISSQPNPPSAPTSVPPLFARFATSGQPAQEPQLIVSSPMLLSSARRDAVPALQSRRSRPAASSSQPTARQARREVDPRGQRNQSYTTIQAQVPTDDHEYIVPPPGQFSPVQPRGRPVSRVPMLDKPLPAPSSEPDPFNSNGPVILQPEPRPLSTLNRNSIQGEYAHLWSVIAGEDEQVLPDPMPTNPIPVPRKAPPRAVAPPPSRHIHNISANSTPDFPTPPLPTMQPLGPDALPDAPLEQNIISPIPTPFTRAGNFDDPDHDRRTQTLTPRPSTRSLSRQDLLTESRSDSGASSSRTTLSSNDVQDDRQLGDVFGRGSDNLSDSYVIGRLSTYHTPANLNPTFPDVSSHQEFDTSSLPSPSSSPKARRKLTKVKPSGQTSSGFHARSSESFEESRESLGQARISPDHTRATLYPPSGNMGNSASLIDVKPLQPQYRDVRSPDGLVNSQRRDMSPPSSVYPQERVLYTSPSPPHMAPSIRSAHGSPAGGKPLIFAALASVGQEEPQAPRPPQVDPVKTWSNQPPPPPSQQNYPSPPSEFSFPARREPLRSQQYPRQNIQPRPVPAAAKRINGYTDTRQLPSPPQPSPSPPKVSQAPQNQTEMVATGSPLPAVRQSLARTRRPSQTRSVAQQSTDFSPHSHSNSMSASYQRTPSKKRPATSLSPGKAGPIQVDRDPLGVPLDDDPFAKVEGVRMLKPTSRPVSPSKEGTAIRKMKSKDSRWGSGDEFHSASEGDSHSDLWSSAAKANYVPTPPSPPVSPGRLLGQQRRHRDARGGELQIFAPPVVQAGEEARDHLTSFLSDPHLLSTLLGFLSFYDWCMVLSLSREIRFALVQNVQLRETVLERFLKTVGYARWSWNDADPVSLSLQVRHRPSSSLSYFNSSLQDLNDYMRGVSTPTHEYARVAALYVHSLSIHPSLRDQSLYDTVRHFAASTRAYTRVVLRLRAQAEREASLARARGGSTRPPSRAPSPTTSSFSHSNHSYTSVATERTERPPLKHGTGSGLFQSPLFRLRRAPLLRVFVPSPDGDWLSDKSVLECEAECRRAGVLGLMRIGDVVWDVAVGDEGNVGRLVWDGSYLIDLDYTFSPIGDLPKYMPTLAFPPSYFHRVIRTGPASSNPIAHIDLRPWGQEIAANLQLLQDRMRTETPQGAYHNVVRWVHRSSFVIRPPVRGGRSPSQFNGRPSPYPPPSGPLRIPIPESNLFVDPGWYGTIVVETEGTNEALADLQDRCGPGAFPPRPARVSGNKASMMDRESKMVFRILREKSRPGEIWIRAVSAKERLL